MEDTLHVAVLNSSVVMAGVASMLRMHPALCIHNAACVSDLPHIHTRTGINVIVFDLAFVSAAEVQSYTDTLGTVTLIGIDLRKEKAFVLSRRSSSLRSVNDLLRLIDLSARY